MAKEIETENKHRHEIKKRTIAFYSVIIVSVIIAVLWGLAFKNRILNFSWRATPENTFIKTAQVDLKNAIDLVEAPAKEKAAAEEAVKTTLKNIIENAIASSTADENASSTRSTAEKPFN